MRHFQPLQCLDPRRTCPALCCWNRASRRFWSSHRNPTTRQPRRSSGTIATGLGLTFAAVLHLRQEGESMEIDEGVCGLCTEPIDESEEVVRVDGACVHRRCYERETGHDYRGLAQERK